MFYRKKDDKLNSGLFFKKKLTEPYYTFKLRHQVSVMIDFLP